MNSKISYSILSVICILLLLLPYFIFETPVGQEVNMFRMFKLLLAAGAGLLLGGAITFGAASIGTSLSITPTTGIIAGSGLLGVATISILIRPDMQDLKKQMQEPEQKILAKIKSEQETNDALTSSKPIVQEPIKKQNIEQIAENQNKLNEQTALKNADSLIAENQNIPSKPDEKLEKKSDFVNEKDKSAIEKNSTLKEINKATSENKPEKPSTQENTPKIAEKRTRISLNENPWKIMIIIKDDVKYEINSVNNVFGITKPRASDIQYGSNTYNVIKDEGQNVVMISAVERLLPNNVGVQKISHWKQGRNTIYLIVRKIPQGYANEYLVFRENKGECFGACRIFSPKIYPSVEKALEVIENHEFDIKYF